jgi:hypothetical protein
MARDTKLEWTNIDLDTLSAEDAARFQETKALYNTYTNVKREFESKLKEAFADQIPEGYTLKFGYMYGKLSVALAEKDAAKQSKSKPARTLADMLADYDNAGLRS